MGAKRYKFKQVVFNSDKELTPNRYFWMPNDAKQIKIQISRVGMKQYFITKIKESGKNQCCLKNFQILNFPPNGEMCTFDG